MCQNGHTHLKILQQMMQDFYTVSHHFTTLQWKGLMLQLLIRFSKAYSESCHASKIEFFFCENT